jgi:hypothetical protein
MATGKIKLTTRLKIKPQSIQRLKTKQTGMKSD